MRTLYLPVLLTAGWIGISNIASASSDLDTCVVPCSIHAIPDSLTCIPAHTLVLFNIPVALRYYLPVNALFEDFLNGTARISGEFVSTTNPNAILHLQIILHNGRTWQEWDALPWYTNYVADCSEGDVPNEEWMYYLIDDDESWIVGSGDLLGTELTLSHAPSNLAFAYQVGQDANYISTGFGSGGWFTFDGEFEDAATGYSTSDAGGAGDVHFLHECMAAACDGILNYDHIVNTTDMLLFTASMSCDEYCGCADIDHNGAVNVADVLLFLSLFGTECD